MALIKKLPDVVANKIAAGEVVQRPASVVKELLENAIDAGADEIIVIIKDAGKSLIQVVDNGCGMTPDDAVMAFERFATSKISDVSDLERLHTLGFRGEALASIAAVSQVELKTKPRDSALATLVRIEGGILQETAPTQAADGTSVSVRNLFFNVPARRKFLKSNATEFKHIYETVQAQALIHTDIGFSLISDGEEIFRFKDESLPERLEFFFGKDFTKGLLEISEHNTILTLHGYLGKPAMTKRLKQEQFLFINQRAVQSRLISHAITQAYGELLSEREQPFYFLSISLDPKHVDVNVHPSKLEVKFDDERNMYQMIHAVVRRAIHHLDFSPAVSITEKPNSFSAPTHMTHSPEAPNFVGIAKHLSYQPHETEIRTTQALHADYKESLKARQLAELEHLAQIRNTLARPSPSAEPLPNQAPAQQVIFSSGATQSEDKTFETLVWQIHNKYILTQIKSGLMIIDQHVAHERILYERALSVMNSGVPNSQQLLFPQRIELKPWEAEILQEIHDELLRLGFSFRLFGGRSILIEGIPPDVRPGSEEHILQEILEQYQTYKTTLSLESRHTLAAAYACRSSIKAGDKLSQREMQVLIDQLFATSMPYICPHGRPIIIKLSLEELDKMFGR
jgi:DNA mismatch repair protein MutL